jgi:hypothetical protein
MNELHFLIGLTQIVIFFGAWGVYMKEVICE